MHIQGAAFKFEISLEEFGHRRRGSITSDQYERGHDYIFIAGEMHEHNVVIATLFEGREYGTGSAAGLASQVKSFFPNLWFGLFVGVTAGLPNLTKAQPLDIRLSGVLVAVSDGDNPGLVAYELGRETGTDGIQLIRKGHLPPNTEAAVISAIRSIKLRLRRNPQLFLQYYDKIKHEKHDYGKYSDPGQELDKLYELGDGGIEHLVSREKRPDLERTRVWYGSIGSGDKLIKDRRKRDELRDKFGINGLEMEAAGTMNHIPVGVIRGVCDYADEHQNQDWQPYAAAMAAAYAKAILLEILLKPQKTIQVICGIVSEIIDLIYLKLTLL
ncbi:nucleoside phosphorylase domain-containing protein [Pseudomassariella vexata]|uniref:Nucleoside phosphorylase domain-containing protein n=1 Tax=Pseudomassariella vexata TaxID=1141098 RepID=A0A1Y2DQB6_9PEZI|nr:nucleoside phosphorylase domain-containing protein [Pseudomassariella vexata]ORY61379.1 nucleoside phosphorylase domain-containing protein [Pseudomassariella vexata]